MASEDAHSLLGQFLHHSYDPGYIVLSYLVSFAGCWTALELLYRRTGTHGFHNWYLLLAAAVSMGSVAIWSMHFIGNRAIVMKHHGTQFQIEYSAGFTAGSFLLPICGVGLAFYSFSTSENVGLLGTLAGGLMLGIAVCGMHYMGNGGISNFTLSYRWQYVVGSAIIAVAASTISLRVFFHLKATWTNTWVKRASCASVLAAAVSGMHWVATAGTEYRLKSVGNAASNVLSRQATAIVVICLSIGACLVLFTYALLGQRSRQRISNRVQQLVLTSVTFDEDGRIMVTPTGLLPSRKITDAYFQQTFGDTFDVDHPVFCWCFRASRCWQTVAELIPGLRSHFRSNIESGHSGSRSHSRQASKGFKSDAEFSTLFKQLFFLTAAELAEYMQEPLTKLGVLFDEVMSTGTIRELKSVDNKPSKAPSVVRNSDSAHLENGPSPLLFGRGQVLFLVRQVNKKDSSRLQATGYRFARAANIVDLMARNMQVRKTQLAACLGRMGEHASQRRPSECGVHLALFAIRPLYNRGFDIIVRRDEKQSLPSASLHLDKLESWQTTILASFDNQSVSAIRENLRPWSVSPNYEERRFANHIMESMTFLGSHLDKTLYEKARLTMIPFRRTCFHQPEHPEQATWIVFRLLINAHDHVVLGDGYGFSPLRLFLSWQHLPMNSEVDQAFSEKIRREFAGFQDRRPSRHTKVSVTHLQNGESPTQLTRVPMKALGCVMAWPYRIRSMSRHVLFSEDSSQHALVTIPSPQRLSGIHVSNQVNIEISELSGTLDKQGIQSPSSHIHGGHSRISEDEESYIDRLLAITVREQRWE